MVLSEKTLYSLGRRCVYIFNRWKAKKEIPACAFQTRRGPLAGQERSRPVSGEIPSLFRPRHWGQSAAVASRATDTSQITDQIPALRAVRRTR